MNKLIVFYRSSSSSSLLLLVVLGLLGVLQSLRAAPLQDASPEQASRLPVVRFDYMGHKVSLPVYEDVTGFTEVRLDFDRRTIRETIGIIQELVDDLMKDDNVVVATGSAVARLIKAAMRQQADYKKLSREDRMPFIKTGYNKEMAQVILAILRSEHKGEPLGDEEVHDRATVLLESIKEVPEYSPSGMYVNWAKMEIDGTPIVAYSEPIIDWFNKSFGRRVCLTAIKAIASFLDN